MNEDAAEVKRRKPAKGRYVVYRERGVEYPARITRVYGDGSCDLLIAFQEGDVDPELRRGVFNEDETSSETSWSWPK